MTTIKASEVRKGMRVGAESTEHNVTVRVEGEVCAARTINNEQVALTFEDGTQRFYAGDHPITVLAEPEPEWVEGAWYWTRAAGQTSPRIRKRMERGWASVGVDGTSTVWLDNGAANFTVLGRVLILDWPGDDVALSIAESRVSSPYHHVQALITQARDAIRTQGGAP